ncbi:MAG: fumarylacetoacetate hydrolase family protein [Anaerolineae bacterium]
MNIARYHFDGDIGYGAREGDDLRAIVGDIFGPHHLGDVVARVEEVDLLAPVQPSKIVAVGRNYRAHAAEMNAELPSEPLLFLKPPSAVIGPGETIRLPSMSSRVDYEAELAVVIGRRAKDVPWNTALTYIFGCTAANDVTARDLQRTDGQWTRAKGFDTFCPIGPWIVTNLDTASVAVRARVNGEVRQDGRTRDLIFDVPYLVSYISKVMTLEPGDVILTGTPAGVGRLDAGDVVEVEIDGVGVLRNPVSR